MLCKVIVTLIRLELSPSCSRGLLVRLYVLCAFVCDGIPRFYSKVGTVGIPDEAFFFGFDCWVWGREDVA